MSAEAAAAHQIGEHEGQRGGVRRAGGAGAGERLTLSEWVRDVLLSAPVEGAPEAGEVVLAELLALRTLFLNLSFRAGKKPLTEAELRGLIERADGVKMQRTRERLAALKTERKEGVASRTNPSDGES